MRRNVIALVAAPLALAAVLGGTAPATRGRQAERVYCERVHAECADRELADDQLAERQNACSLTQNALSAAGSSLDQLDGVAVEAVVLPSAAR